MNRKKYLKILGGGVGAALLLPHTVFAQSKGKIIYDDDIILDGEQVQQNTKDIELLKAQMNKSNFL